MELKFDADIFNSSLSYLQVRNKDLRSWNALNKTDVEKGKLVNHQHCDKCYCYGKLKSGAAIFVGINFYADITFFSSLR